jgi:CRISPR/Cas system-associated protein Csm6
MTVVITPVGTSLFTNGSENNSRIQSRFSVLKDLPLSNWDNNSSYIENLRTESEKFIRSQKVSASAELQSTARIQNALDQKITVHLLASDTIASRLAAEILTGGAARQVLDNVTVKFDATIGDVKKDVIDKLQVDNSRDFLKEGMNALIRRIGEIHSTLVGNEQSLAINITGGYGATLPYLTIFAQLKRIPLYYNFEDSNELIEISPVPLIVDWGEIGSNFNVLKKINDGKAIDNWGKFRQKNYEAVKKLEPFILVDDNGDSAYPSPLTEVFWDELIQQDLNERYPDPVSTLPDEKNVNTSKVEHHRPSNWETFVRQLCENVYVKSVSYDALAHGSGNGKVLDSGKDGHIGVVYSRGDQKLPLRVVTSAIGQRQTELVLDFIKRQLKIR